MPEQQNATLMVYLLLLMLRMLRFICGSATIYETPDPSNMPKSTPDPVLQKELADFVEANGGVRPAARLLGLEHTVVYRFGQEGRAIPRTRAAISAALAKHESATKNATSETVAGASPHKAEPPAEGDLLLLRNLCSSVIALIDNYNGAGGDLAALRRWGRS